MVDMTCELHDEAAAGSQFVTHFTGRMLQVMPNYVLLYYNRHVYSNSLFFVCCAVQQLKLQSTVINTRGFDTLLELVDNTCKDSFDLFYALYKFNPSANDQLECMGKAFAQVKQMLEKSNDTNCNTNANGSYYSFSERAAALKPSGTVAMYVPF